MSDFYACYIPTGEVTLLLTSSKGHAKAIIKQADFYIDSHQKLSYTFFKSEHEYSPLYRTYIPRDKNHIFLELIER